MSILFHLSGWDKLATIQKGETFTLRPGTQNAEGVGVYFSEGEPRLSAAEGCHGSPVALIVIEAAEDNGWWQSKAAKAKKFGKPRTWHSDKKHVQCCIESIGETLFDCGAVRTLHCSFQFVQESEVR